MRDATGQRSDGLQFLGLLEMGLHSALRGDVTDKIEGRRPVAPFDQNRAQFGDKLAFIPANDFERIGGGQVRLSLEAADVSIDDHLAVIRVDECGEGGGLERVKVEADHRGGTLIGKFDLTVLGNENGIVGIFDQLAVLALALVQGRLGALALRQFGPQRRDQMVERP